MAATYFPDLARGVKISPIRDHHISRIWCIDWCVVCSVAHRERFTIDLQR
jgi:hypothetical protein